MAIIVRVGAFNGPRLSEELEVAIPSLVEPEPGSPIPGARRPLYSVETRTGPARVRVEVPDQHTAAAGAVLDSHNPNAVGAAAQRQMRLLAARVTARNKLTALGFTDNEVTVILGGLTDITVGS